MAKQKSKKKKKKPASGRSGRKIFLFLFFSLLLASTLAATIYFIFLLPGTEPGRRATPPKPAIIDQPQKFRAAPEAANLQKPTYKEPQQPAKTIASNNHKQPATASSPTLPRLAIIIDDIGHRQETGRKLIALDINLSFAFLPNAPHTPELMNLAHQQQRDILLHLPMEPSSPKWSPGPGALFTTMSDQAIIKQVTKNLAAVPLAIGVNNHMGSKFSQDRAKMAAALQPLKKQGLFFIDSLTISSSVAGKVAAEMGIKSAQRDIFLDNDKDVAKIKKQLDQLVKRAKTHGSAIGIGHPYGATLSALEKYQYWLQKEVEIVAVHTLVY